MRGANEGERKRRGGGGGGGVSSSTAAAAPLIHRYRRLSEWHRYCCPSGPAAITPWPVMLKGERRSRDEKEGTDERTMQTKWKMKMKIKAAMKIKATAVRIERKMETTTTAGALTTRVREGKSTSLM